jgi:hypothetical protein
VCERESERVCGRESERNGEYERKRWRVWKGGPLQRGDNHKNVKMGWGHIKILLQNHWANFNQTWHKSSLVGGIQVCSNEGDSPSQRGDNSKRVKIHRKVLNSSSPVPVGKIQSNLVQIIFV